MEFAAGVIIGVYLFILAAFGFILSLAWIFYRSDLGKYGPHTSRVRKAKSDYDVALTLFKSILFFPLLLPVSIYNTIHYIIKSYKIGE